MTVEQKSKRPQWVKIDIENVNQCIQELIDSIEVTRDEKNRVEIVFLHGRIAYIQTYVRDKGELYERLENKYHVSNLDEIIGYWKYNSEQRRHEKRIKDSLGDNKDY